MQNETTDPRSFLGGSSIAPRTAFAVVAAQVILALMSSTAPAQQAASAVQWVSNCIANAEKPEGQKAYTTLGKTPPLHSENIAWCKEQWNLSHPKEKITAQNEDKERDGWRYPPTPAQWIYECAADYDGPRGRRAAAATNSPVPTHAQNIQMCTREWNGMRPNQRVYLSPLD